MNGKFRLTFDSEKAKEITYWVFYSYANEMLLSFLITPGERIFQNLLLFKYVVLDVIRID